MTPVKFFFTMTLTPIRCRNCGIKLKPGRLMKLLVYGGYLMGVIFALVHIYLREFAGWNLKSTVTVYIISLLTVGIPLEIYGWKKVRYGIDP